MTDSRGSDSKDVGLAMLLVDVLSGDDEEIELLLRYARDPASLRPAKRRDIERRLAESPAYADQLRVLRRLRTPQVPTGSTDPD